MDRKNSLSAFIPRNLWPLLRGGDSTCRLEGSALFADLAGFTQLTDSLAVIGKEGAEELTRILNDFFSAMIKIVHRDGGDIIRFGGDAMTIFISSGPDEAVATALRLQRECLNYQKVETRAGAFVLGMKIGVSAGKLFLSLAGDDKVGYDYFAAGSSLDLSAEAEHHAKQGQVVLCPKAVAALSSSSFKVTPVGDGFAVVEPLPDSEAAPESPARDNGNCLPSEEEMLRFLPGFIREKSLIKEERQVGEHRRTTTLFLSFKGLDYDNDPNSVPMAKTVYKEVAGLVKKYGGSVNKMDMGDKGSKILALFGSPVALEHQEEMGCRCAIEIVGNQAIQKIIKDIKIGLTVSSVFSAYVGCDERREYTVMGNGINLSARLMSAAPPNGVLVSDDVYEKAKESIEFKTLEPISVKGKIEKVPVFQPLKVSLLLKTFKNFVGREEKIEIVLNGIKDQEFASNIAITGPAGIGKSLFLMQVKSKCDEERIETIYTKLASYDKEKFFGAWKAIIYHCLETDAAEEPQVMAEAISKEIEEGDRKYIPLFNDLFRLNIPENSSTKALTSKDRKDIFFAIISRLIIKKISGGPHCIFIDHMDYADPSSIEFLGELSTDAKGTSLKILVTLRETSVASFKEILRDAETIILESFSEKEIKEFLVQIEEFASPPQTFLDFLLKKTGGNPKFLGEIVSIIKKQKLAFIGPSGRFEVDEDKLSSAIFPDTLQSLFLARVESLKEEEKQLLKSASVLGSSFSIDTLGAITESSGDDVIKKIRELEYTGLVRMDTWGVRHYASFTDNLLRDAIYDSLNFQLKRELHLKVALYLEKEGSASQRVGPVLARHYESAGEEDKALVYLWKSAEYSRSLYDNRSAFDYLGRFVAISEKRGASPSSDKNFLDALMYYADVQQELGRIAEADVLYQRILDEIKEVGQDTVKATSRLADNKRRMGSLKESLELYDKALEGAKQLKDEALQCRIFLDSGVPLAMMSKMGKAMDHFQRAENIAVKLNDFPSLVYALMNRGLVEYSKGKLEGAKSLLQKARETAKERDLKSYLALITANLAQVYFEMGEYEKALAICKEAVEVSMQFGYRNHLVIAMTNKALFETMLGRYDEAELSSDKALLAAGHYEMGYLISTNYHVKSLLLLVDGAFSKALEYQRKALAIYIKGGHFGEALGCLSEIISITNFLNLPELAVPIVGENVLKLQNELQNVTRTWTISYNAHYNFHRFLLGEIDSCEAIDNMENVLERARESGILWLVADVGNVLLKLYQKEENHSKAAETGMDLFPLLSTHYCPLILPRFLITLANSLAKSDSQDELESVLESLATYESFLDRGTYGLEYSLLLNTLDLSHSDEKARSKLNGAKNIAAMILENENDEKIKEALLLLPTIQAIMKKGRG